MLYFRYILLDDVENMFCFIITAQKAQLTSINNFFLSISFSENAATPSCPSPTGNGWTLVSDDVARVSPSNFFSFSVSCRYYIVDLVSIHVDLFHIFIPFRHFTSAVPSGGGAAGGSAEALALGCWEAERASRSQTCVQFGSRCSGSFGGSLGEAFQSRHLVCGFFWWFTDCRMPPCARRRGRVGGRSEPSCYWGRWMIGLLGRCLVTLVWCWSSQFDFSVYALFLKPVWNLCFWAIVLVCIVFWIGSVNGRFWVVVYFMFWTIPLY